METNVQLPPMLRSHSTWASAPDDISFERVAAQPVQGAAEESMQRPAHAFRALLLGLALTLAQLFLAVGVLAPAGPLSWRYDTLIQHDSYWFANIADRGYGTIVPPLDRKMMEVSNVAFFPAYPGLAGLLHHWLGLNTYTALLLTAQIAAWGFWSYFFLFCDRWKLSPLLQFCGALAIAAHPTAFFLVAGYSESLFMMALFGFIYWSTAKGGAAKVFASLHGIVMSATRIVGLPCAAYPMVRSLFVRGWAGLRQVRGWLGQYAGAALLTFAAMLGGLGFFLYCLLRWGRWDLYMQTQNAGWAIMPDYLAVFKPASYRWLLPPLDDPTQWSQMTMTVGGLLFLAVALCELIARYTRPAEAGPSGGTRFRASSLGRATNWQARMGLYFAAFVTYYLAVSGVASVQMESMLRYQFCAHALIVLALLHFLAQFRTPPPLARAFGMAAVALLSVAGLSLQGWWVWNFTRGGWVA